MLAARCCRLAGPVRRLGRRSPRRPPVPADLARPADQVRQLRPRTGASASQSPRTGCGVEWNLAALAALATGHPGLALTIGATASSLLGERLHRLPRGRALAARTTLLGLTADAAGIGRLLRREWWPLGALAVLASPRSRAARVVTGAMIGPLVWEWLRGPRAVDLPRYLCLRILDDAAYGTGVVAASVRARSLVPLVPRVRGLARPPGRARLGGLTRPRVSLTRRQQRPGPT